MRLLSRTVIAMIALVIVGGSLSAAQPNAAEILRKSYQAEKQATFAGQLKTTIRGQGGATSASAKVYQSGAKSRMEYTSGPSAGRIIIDDGSSLIRLEPGTKTAYVSATGGAADALDLMLRNYTPAVVGSARIAGRDCYQVKLKPRNANSPTRQLWIDKTRFVTLRMEGYGSDGRVDCGTVYTSIDYSARPSASLFKAPSGWKSVRLGGGDSIGLDSVRKAVGFTPKKPGYVPKGYAFGGYFVRNTPGCRAFAGLRYTNGMNAVSVFESQGGCPGPGFGRGQGFGRGRGRGQGCGMGRGAGCGAGCMLLADNPQAKAVSTWSGDLMVVVVGDMAQSELVKIANSVK